MTSDARQECVVFIGRNGTSPDEILSCGTAFLARYDGRVWVISALHVPYDAPPHNDWSLFPKSMEIRTCTFDNHVLDLGNLIDASNNPLFLYTTQGNGILADFMAIPLVDGSLPAWLSHVHIFDLNTDIREAVVSEEATLWGYPEEKTILTATPTKIWALPTTKSVLQTEQKVVKGNSGGPLIGSDGKLLGMALGSGNGRGRFLGSDSIKYLIDHSSLELQARQMLANMVTQHRAS